MQGAALDQDEALRLLNALFAERREHDAGYGYGRFGKDLAKMAGRGDKPYARQYISNVLHAVKGYPVSNELVQALQRLYAVQDGLDTFLASLQNVPTGVLSERPLPAGSVVMGAPRLCARAGCGLTFVSDNSRRKFCPRCRPSRKRHGTP